MSNARMARRGTARPVVIKQQQSRVVAIFLFLLATVGLLQQNFVFSWQMTKNFAWKQRHRRLPSSVWTPSRRTISIRSRQRAINVLRGGAASAIDGGAKEVADDTIFEQKYEKAMNTMLGCSKAALVSGIVHVVEAFLYILQEWNNSDDAFTFEDFGSLIQTTHRFLIFISLRRVWKILGAPIRRDEGEQQQALQQLTAYNMYDINDTLSRMWMRGAIAVTIGAMVMFTTLANDLTSTTTFVHSNRMVSKLLKRPRQFLLAVASAIILVPIQQTVKRTTKAAVAGGNPPRDKDYAVARQKGLVTARNQLYCMGALALNGAISLICALMKPTWPAKGLAMTDVADVWIMCGLLATLNRGYIRAVVASTANTKDNQDDTESYVGLFEAQTGFYGKLQKVFNLQSIILIATLLASGVKSVLARR